MAPASPLVRQIALQSTFAGAVLTAALLASPAFGDADGPDYYRVRGVASGSSLNLRAEPSVDAPRLLRIPAGATCVRNLGCRGGLTLEEFTTLPETAKRWRERDNPRWCRVEYAGTVGWVAGRYLAEDGCSERSNAAPKK